MHYNRLMQQINETIGGNPPPLPFSVTEAAAARIAYLLSDEPAGTHFFVSVQGGGCSGFQYMYELLPREIAPSDTVIGDVVVDDVSLPLLANSTLDYVEDLASAGFQIKNPNATAKCGCGNSFSISL